MISEQQIMDATCEIFDTMVMIPVKPEQPYTKKQTTFKNSVSSMVGLAGNIQGIVGVHATEEVARDIAGNFLDSEFGKVDEEVKDALCELANMLAGFIKSSLSDRYDVQISIPSVIHGDYTLLIYSNAQWIMIPFRIKSGKFLVEVQLKTNPL